MSVKERPTTATGMQLVSMNEDLIRAGVTVDTMETAFTATDIQVILLSLMRYERLKKKNNKKK